ncbi:MAG TPA: phytoene/squalene synthase family protein [Thermodesulfovibrionia bacterium]|nr:phytoene/squalene synthase family protein [Thermodesulfovibrionia bacterium]
MKAKQAELSEDFAYQDHILQDVSRTFALTIPQLPENLCQVVGNAYLLCRIADTIEDDPHIPFTMKQVLYQDFIDVIGHKKETEVFSEKMYPLLSDKTTSAEKDLIQNAPKVIRITHSFSKNQQTILEKCLRIMSYGMERFVEQDTSAGLKDMSDLDRYCYHVAGVVGEMLTELFCDYSPRIARNRETLLNLAVSFGQGLQMTNILKDIWDDKNRGYCWLPVEVFQSRDFQLKDLSPMYHSEVFKAGLTKLISAAHGHLWNALKFTLLIPPWEQGIRRFCLYALGMAVLTLNKTLTHLNFSESRQVKITRKTVKATILVSNMAVSNDTLLKILFRIIARNLPFKPINPALHSQQCSHWHKEAFVHHETVLS